MLSCRCRSGEGAAGRALLRKVAIGLALILVLLVAGLLAAPYFVGLDRLKPIVASQIEQRTGRALDIAGPLRLALLPTPSIGARDVRLGNPAGAAVPDMLRARAVDVKLAFWPLLIGRIEIRSATLVDPEVDIERLPDGRGNWQIARPAKSADDPAPFGAALFGPPGAPDFFIRYLDIENGSVTYRSGASAERFEHINGSLTLDAPEGPFRIAADMVSHGAALNVTADGGPFEDATLPLHMVIVTRPSGQVDFNGSVGGELDAPDVKGKLKLSVGDLAGALTILRHEPASPLLGRPLTLAADLGVAGPRITLDHASIDFGTAHADGVITMTNRAPRVADLVLHMTRFDLDRWLGARSPVAAKGSNAGLRTTPDGKPTVPPDRSASLVAFVIPETLKGSIDLSVDDLLWRGGILRGASLKAKLDNGVVAIERIAAVLPGSTAFSASGTASSPKGVPHASGHAELAAADVRGLIGWLGYSVGDVPADRLRGLSLTSQFSLAGDQFDLKSNDVTLDATRFQATASVLLRGKPGIGLHLSADHVNLDAYMAPPPILSSSAMTTTATASSSAAMPGAEKPMLISLLGDMDASLDATLGEATWRGQSLRQLHLAGMLQDGGLSIDELSIGDLGGSAGKVTGLVEGLAGNGLKGQLFFDAHGPAFERVLRLAWPDATFGQSYGAFRVEGGAQVGEGSADLDADLEILGGRVHAVGILSDAVGGTDLSLTADHPSFGTLVHNLWPTYRPAGGDIGAVKFAAKLKGGSGQLAIDGLSLAIGPAALSGAGAVSFDGARPKITAALTLGDWAIDTFLPARRTAGADDGPDHASLLSGVMLAEAGTAAPRSTPSPRWSRSPIDWSDLQLVDAAVTVTGRSVSYGAWRLDQPAATVSLADGTIDIGKLVGKLYGGQAEGSVHLATKALPSLHAQIALHDADLKAALTGLAGLKAIDGRLDLAADLTTGGVSQLDLISHLDGTVTVGARNGSLAGFDLKAIVDRLDAVNRPVDLLALAKSATGGATRFSALDGTFRLKDGVATGDDLHLAVEAGDGRGAMMLDGPAWTVDTRIDFRLASTSGVPPLSLRVTGSLDEPHPVFDVGALSQFLAQRALARTGDAAADIDKNPKLRDLLRGLGLHP